MGSAAGKRSGPVLKTLLRLGLFFLALAPLAYTIYRDWPALLAALAEVDWPLLSLSFAALLALMPLMAGIGWMVLRWLMAGLTLWQIFSIYFISQLPKYLPGGVWAFPGRVLLYQRAGLAGRISLYAVVREVGALFLGAALVGASGMLAGLELTPALQWAIGAGALASAAILVAVQFPAFWRWLGEIRLVNLKPLMRFMPVDDHYRGLGWFLPSLAASVVFWLAMGLPFRWLAMAVNPAAASLNWLQHAAVFALAWAAGFVVIFAPAGLGIRESALTLLLGRWVPAGDALAIALLSRLCWIAAEAVLIAFSLQGAASLRKPHTPA